MSDRRLRATSARQLPAVAPAAATYLRCDYDGRIPRDMWTRLEMVARLHRLRVRWLRVDRTQHGYHIVICVSNRIALPRQILLQALLGSDWKREAFNSARVLRLRDVPTFWRRRVNVLYLRHYRGVTL
jgi:hypothetical protein